MSNCGTPADEMSGSYSVPSWVMAKAGGKRKMCFSSMLYAVTRSVALPRSRGSEAPSIELRGQSGLALPRDLDEHVFRVQPLPSRLPVGVGRNRRV